MATKTVYNSWAKYRPRTAAEWRNPYNGKVMAGNNASGGIYRALWYFPTSMLTISNVNSATIYFNRPSDAGYAKSLRIAIASSYNSDGSANIIEDLGTITISAGTGDKSFGISAVSFGNLASYGYIYVWSDSNGEYTEFLPDARVVINYTEKTPPGAPTNLNASPNPYENSITITWTKGSDGINNSIINYHLYYQISADGANWGSEIGVACGNVSSYGIDTSTWARGTYFRCHIASIGSGGDNTWSNWCNTIRKNLAPSAPTNLRYNNVAYNTAAFVESPIIFSWDTVNGAERYEVQLGVWNGNGYTFGSAISVGKSTQYSWDISGYSRGQRLWIQVRTVDTLGASSAWVGLNNSAIFYNQLPIAPIIDYPIENGVVYSVRPRICFVLAEEPDGQAQKPITAIGDVNANNGDYSRSGSFYGTTKLAVRFPTTEPGNKTVNICGNDGVANGPNATRDFTVSSPNWTDNLALGTPPVKAVHITELRTAINNIRAAYGLDLKTWTDTITAGETPVKAVHITEMRQALEEVREKINGYDNQATQNLIPVFNWSSDVERNKAIKAVHIIELRNAVESI